MSEEELSEEVKAIVAKFNAGEILTDDELEKLPEEVEVEE
jgi:uncharacterized coiled-coil DUF342 family protein